MKIEIRLRIDAGDDGPCAAELLVLDKPHDQIEQVGHSVAKAKELLNRVQERVVGAQAAAFLADNRHCGICGKRLWSRGRTSFRFRTPFGDVPVNAPRLKRCRCDRGVAGLLGSGSDPESRNPFGELSVERAAKSRSSTVRQSAGGSTTFDSEPRCSRRRS